MSGAPSHAAERAAPEPRDLLPAGTALTVLLAAWMTAGVLGARLPAGEDMTAHLLRADFAIPELVARGRLDGWFPRFFVGHQAFLFNGPGVVWVMAALRGLTLGLLSNAGALKVLALGSFLAVPLATAFVARSLGLSRPACALAPVLALAVSTPFGLGVQGLFVTGLLGHQLGAVLFLLALGSGLRVLSSGGRRHVVLTAVSLAGLLVTHLISVMVLALLAPLLLLARLASSRDTVRGAGRRLALVAPVTLGLAAFWLVPLLVHRDLRGIVASWGTPPLPDRLRDILAGHLLFRPAMAGAVAVGLLWALSRWRRPLLVALAVTPLAYLVAAHALVAAAPRHEVALQLANRGLGYAGLLAVLPLAELLAGLAEHLGSGLRRSLRHGLALLGAGALVALPFGPWRSLAQEMDEPRPALVRTAAALASLVPDGARFATARDYPLEIFHTGIQHPEIWLAQRSGRNSLNGFNVEASSTPSAAFLPEAIARLEADDAADALARLGVTHLVTTSPALGRRLSASPRLRPVFEDGPLRVLEVAALADHPVPSSLLATSGPASARLRRAGSERLELDVETPGATPATIALAWSPKWHASLDGRAVPLRRASDGLAEVDLPQGASRLVLTFRDDAWDAWGRMVTLLVGLGLAVRGLRPLARRRRSPRPRAEPVPARLR